MVIPYKRRLTLSSCIYFTILFETGVRGQMKPQSGVRAKPWDSKLTKNLEIAKSGDRTARVLPYAGFPLVDLIEIRRTFFFRIVERAIDDRPSRYECPLI